MKTLTKKYQIVHEGTNLLFPLEERTEGSVCYVGEGKSSAEFDTIDEAEKYISDNKLVYTEPAL